MLTKNKWPPFKNRTQYWVFTTKTTEYKCLLSPPGICFAVCIRKWSQGQRKSVRGGYQGPIECLPELMAACEGKENVFASIVGSELQAAHISQVTLSICDHYHCDWKGRGVGQRNTLSPSVNTMWYSV